MRGRVPLSVVVALTATAACLAGCRPGGETSGGTGGSASTDVLATDSDFGTTKQVRVGQILDLALPDNPSTGYSWHYEWEPKAGLRVFSINDTGARTRRPGSGATQHVRFLAQQAGTVVITLQHGRWWEGGERDPPAKLTVQITP
jgi:inhibitor of cysteine peptidase